MSGFAQALRAYREGELSREGLLTEVERELGPRFYPQLCDLSDVASRAQLTARIRELERPIDVFLSNAAECVYESSLPTCYPNLQSLPIVRFHAKVHPIFSRQACWRRGRQDQALGLARRLPRGWWGSRLGARRVGAL